MPDGIMEQKVTTDDAMGMDIEDLCSMLDSGRGGLTTSEATKRLQAYGPNEIQERKKNPLLKFLGYFWGPIPWMIEAAIILSAIIQHWEDFGIILLLLLINAVVGYWQERKADNAIEMLKKSLAFEARVKRDGNWIGVQSRELVPGDVVRVRPGDIVPADIKLVDGKYLQMDESALTGESLPVDKKEGDVAYSGSAVKQGEMDGLVVGTGLNTFFGKTTKLVEEARTQSHFQRAVVKIGDYLIVMVIIMVSTIIVASLFRAEPVTDTVQFALVLTVAAIPAALPAVLSITMAVGAMALAKKEAIVSRLVAIEEMAGMDVLCSDKTGTITQNKLTLSIIRPMGGFDEREILMIAALASREENKDPIDDAVIKKARSMDGMDQLLSGHEVREFQPFDPVSKRIEVTVTKGGKEFKVSKGAPQVILGLMEDSEGLRKELDKGVESFASKGGRSLGVARTDDQGKWVYMGLLSLSDPPREDSAETIKTAREMGVDIRMITGDHISIAREIAREVGLGTNIVTPDSFQDKPDSQAMGVIEESSGFAEMFPEHKFKIVEDLQSSDHIVGMTGDGVNDAPALKKADVGIAVEGATDAAKSAADIVLTRPGLGVIIDALKESRRIFQRMNHYVIYRIAETIRVLFFVSLAILAFNSYPIDAVMIVLLALFNDIPIMTIAYDNVRYSRNPDRWNMREVLTLATIIGFVGVVSSFIMLFIVTEWLALDPVIVQTVIFLKLTVAGHLTIFVARTRGPFWSIRPGKLLLWSAVITKIIATLMAVYGVFMSPIGWELAGLVWAWSLVWALLIMDQTKIAVYRFMDHGGIRFRRHPVSGAAHR